MKTGITYILALSTHVSSTWLFFLLPSPCVAIVVQHHFTPPPRPHATPSHGAAADHSYDDFLAGEREHSSFVAPRARHGDGGWGSTGPCQCAWAGEDRSGCEGKNDGSRCFNECCACQCAWTGADKENCEGGFDASYCFGQCCPQQAAAATTAAARAAAAPSQHVTALNAARYGGVTSALHQAKLDYAAKHADAGLPTAVPTSRGAASGAAYGPVSGTVGGGAGWAIENGHGELAGSGGFRVVGNTRAYLVEQHAASSWDAHRYVSVPRIDHTAQAHTRTHVCSAHTRAVALHPSLPRL